MAYNNYYPIGYQQQMYQPVPQNNGGIIWVQGEAGAKSYLVAPNTTVQLWDSENQSIYLKSADASGMPSIKILDYKIRDTSDHVDTPFKDRVEYATMESIKDLEKRLTERIKKLEGEVDHE